jgi:hypothetical protein
MTFLDWVVKWTPLFAGIGLLLSITHIAYSMWSSSRDRNRTISEKQEEKRAAIQLDANTIRSQLELILLEVSHVKASCPDCIYLWPEEAIEGVRKSCHDLLAIETHFDTQNMSDVRMVEQSARNLGTVKWCLEQILKTAMQHRCKDCHRNKGKPQ